MGKPWNAWPGSAGALWRRVWSRPEPDISDLAFSGELLVAGVRLLLVVLLLYFPGRDDLPRLLGGTPGPRLHGLSPTLGMASLALLAALGIYSTVHRNRGRSWIGFASSVLDVTLVSGVLALLPLTAGPRAAGSEAAVFPAYLLVIAATTLRYDARITLATGALALVQYGALAAWAGQAAGPSGGGGASGFPLWVHGGRLALLAASTLVAATVVVRSRELRLLSTRDRFTGLLNRAVFDERLAREHRLARRMGDRFAVAMIDIDRFKRFNDEHGHAAGDEALRRVADLLRQSCRTADVVARYGGEEFALILPGVRHRAAQSLCERIRHRIAGERLRPGDGARAVSLTVSIGVASWPEDGADGAEVLARADRRLYQAKREGRNRVTGPPAAPARSRPRAAPLAAGLEAAFLAPAGPPDSPSGQGSVAPPWSCPSGSAR